LTGPLKARDAVQMSSLASELPQPQRLALTYAPARARPATEALLALDARLAAILRARREPIAAQLRLAWWRDVLARPVAEWPRGEPVLDSLRGWRDPSGLSDLAVGWEALLADALTPAAIAEFVAGRGRAFACLARELGVEPTGSVEEAARIWALADLAANISDGAERALVVEYGRDLVPPPLSASLRPLAVLAGLGTRALRLGGVSLLSGPGSTLLALRIGLAGR
jgi:phytoene synthase